MLHLNPDVEGLLMPPDCIKSGVLDDGDAAPVGLDVGKDSSSIMAEPGPLQIHGDSCIRASRCENRLIICNPGQWPRCVGLTPSLVAAIWLRIACVADPARRQRLKAKWEAGGCSESTEQCHALFSSWHRRACWRSARQPLVTR